MEITITTIETFSEDEIKGAIEKLRAERKENARRAQIDLHWKLLVESMEAIQKLGGRLCIDKGSGYMSSSPTLDLPTVETWSSYSAPIKLRY